MILRAVEQHIAFHDIDASQHRGIGLSPANMQIGVAGKLGQRGFHAQLGRGKDVDIEPQIIEERVLGGCCRGFCAGQVLRKIKVGIHGKAGDGHGAGEL